MRSKILRLIAALVLALAAGGTGYLSRAELPTIPEPAAVVIPAATVTAPVEGTTRVVYSLDKKKNDDELIALINAARSHIYFAIYTFTLDDVATALIAAKERGVEVRGLVDSGQASQSFEKPLIDKLLGAGIPLLTENHGGKGGIMHIKLLVTEQAYAFGSYNWTASATTKNDEILEIGTAPDLRQTYENILLKLFAAYTPK